MRRREFIGLLGGATAWPLALRAQQAERLRRIGAIIDTAADHPEARARVQTFLQTLRQSGWSENQNVTIDYRWGTGSVDLARRYATELLALMPDVIVAAGSPAVAALQQTTATVPVVFVNVADPVGAGFVANLARPGGNTTGFTVFEYGLSAKWLELLKEIAPRVARAAVFRDAASPPGLGQWGAVQAIAPSLGIELSPIGVREVGEMERALKAFVRGSNDGLIVTASPLTGLHHALIIALASSYRLPAVYPYRYFVASGGLLSYGPDMIDPWRRAAGYVDRILKGEKPSDLPVQAPTKYELVINMKTAKALGLAVPPGLLARADEVID